MNYRPFLMTRSNHTHILFCCMLAMLLVARTHALASYSSSLTVEQSPQLTTIAQPVQVEDLPAEQTNRLLSIIINPVIFANDTDIDYTNSSSTQNSTQTNSTIQNYTHPIVITPQNTFTSNYTTPSQNGTSTNSISNNNISDSSSNNITINSSYASNETSENMTDYSSVLPFQLDYSIIGLLSSDEKKLSFCNSSWAIAAAYLYQYKLLSLGINTYTSEQAIIGCSSFYSTQNRTNDCSGGYFEDALRFLSLVGSVPKRVYPSTSYNLATITHRTGICTDKNRVYVGEGRVVVINNASNDEIKELLNTYGPLVVTLYADTDFYQYQSGTFSSCPANAGSMANLTVLLFGYSANDYWLIRAPFGKNWGYVGSMRLSMSNNCGLSNRLGYIDYTSVSSNTSQFLDPTIKYNKQYQSASPLCQKYILYASIFLLLIVGFAL